MAMIYGRSGYFKGVAIPLPPRGLTLGREPARAGRLTFDDRCDDISRSHCSVQFDQRTRHFEVTDLGSSNGTFLVPDDHPLTAHRHIDCENGQLIRLGQHNVLELIAETEASAPEQELSLRSIEEKISLSALVGGFANFFRSARAIGRHPFKFPQRLDMEDDKALQDALGFVFYAILLLFFGLVPVFSKFGLEVSKITFVIRYAAQFSLFCVLLHWSLRFIGRSQRGIRTTVIIYSYLIGVFAPLNVLLYYPVFLSFGPEALFGTMDDTLRLARFYQENPGLMDYVTAVNLVFGILALTINVSWFSRVHRVGKLRVVVSFFVAGLVGGVVQLLILNPLFHELFESIEHWQKYI